MSCRKLRVIQIEDRSDIHLTPSLYEQYLDLLSPAAEVKALSGQILQNTQGMPDLILTDVDMGEVLDPAVRDFEWGATGKVPYGPILALPFLRGARVRAFEPYSAWWSTPEIVNNGFVALSVAMLLAASRGEPVGLDEAKDHIRDTEHLTADPNVALSRSLLQYRRLLSSRAGRDIQIVDAKYAMERLYMIEEKADDEPLRLPFADETGTIVVGIQQEGMTEWIELTSLFADVLAFRPRIESERLQPIYDQLTTWSKVSIEAQGSTLFDIACSVLKGCRKPGSTVTRVVDDKMNQLNEIDPYLVKRMCVLFAWVSAWYSQPKASQRITRAREVLGYLVEVVDPDGKKKQRIHSDVGHLYPRILAGQDRIYEGENQARRPFTKTPEKGSLNDAYQLKRNERYDLTNYDRELCRKYALDELDWCPEYNEEDPPYPLWME